MFNYELLIFDPLRKGSKLKNILQVQVNKQEILNIKPNCDSLSRMDKVSLEHSFLISMSLPLDCLLQRDCQIVLCSGRQTLLEERAALKTTPPVLSALPRDN